MKCLFRKNRTAAVVEFLRDLDKFCRDRGFELGHEDAHGSFEVYISDGTPNEWLLDATDYTQEDDGT